MTSPGEITPDLSNLAGSWVLDPDQTSIVFHTKAMWVLKVKGTAKALEGAGTVEPDGSFSGSLVIDAGSIDTKNKKRDDHLRTADFLETAVYPTIRFAATGGRPAESGRVEVTGDLTIHGQTRPLTMLADVEGTDGSATVSADVDIDRSSWGLTWAKMGAAVANRVEIRAHFTKA